MMQRMVVTGLVVMLVLSSSGCVKKLVNNAFPPIDTLAKKRQAVAESETTLQSLPRVDLYANIGAADIKRIITPSLLAAIPELKSLDISLTDQEIIATAALDGKFVLDPQGKKLPCRLEGSISAHATLFITQNQLPHPLKDQLKWTPWATRVQISRIEIEGKRPAPKLLAKLITAALNDFLPNISQAIGTQTIDFKINGIEDKFAPEMITGPGIEEVTGKVAFSGVRFERGAVLIDESGVHAAVKLSEGSNDIHFQSTPFLAATVDANADFKQQFDQYRHEYRGMVEANIADDIESAWLRTSALLSKAYVAGLVNTAFDNPHVEAKIALSHEIVQSKTPLQATTTWRSGRTQHPI